LGAGRILGVRFLPVTTFRKDGRTLNRKKNHAKKKTETPNNGDMRFVRCTLHVNQLWKDVFTEVKAQVTIVDFGSSLLLCFLLL
jgi:hypothetical protein